VKIVTGILLFLCVCDATGQETRAGELAGRAVEMIVVKPEDLSPVAWPPEQIELKQISATVTHDKNIYMLLQEPGSLQILEPLHLCTTSIRLLET